MGHLIGLNKSFTPRGMGRRTFNDLMRLANMEAIVTKSISGSRASSTLRSVASGWTAK